MNNDKLVPIFFTIDESYVPWLAVALTSMKENASSDYDYRIHIITEDVSDESKARLKAHESDNFRIQFTEMPKNLDAISDREENYLRADFFTLTIFFRLFLADMFPQYDKAIYLDGDICVPGDISEMFKIDLGTTLLGVVNDYSIAGIPELTRYVKEAVGVDHKRYFNSGILLMNFKEMREKNLAGRFLELLQRDQFDTIAPDQDYLNAMCKDNVTYLPNEWDSMPCDLPEFKNPQVIHYNLFDKPWCYDDVKYEDYFWKYAEESGFEKEIHDFKDHYSDEQKASDQKAMGLLVSRSASIPDQEVTMRKIFESGQEERL